MRGYASNTSPNSIVMESHLLNGYAAGGIAARSQILNSDAKLAGYGVCFLAYSRLWFINTLATIAAGHRRAGVKNTFLQCRRRASLNCGLKPYVDIAHGLAKNHVIYSL
jgi:hypothetical protein